MANGADSGYPLTLADAHRQENRTVPFLQHATCGLLSD
jgi:hypothetical protein